MSGTYLGSVRVWEDDAVHRGKFLGSEVGIWAHPLDALALRYPRAVDRIEPAIAWLLGRTLRALDRATPRAADDGRADD